MPNCNDPDGLSDSPIEEPVRWDKQLPMRKIGEFWNLTAGIRKDL